MKYLHGKFRIKFSVSVLKGYTVVYVALSRGVRFRVTSVLIPWYDNPSCNLGQRTSVLFMSPQLPSLNVA